MDCVLNLSHASQEQLLLVHAQGCPEVRLERLHIWSCKLCSFASLDYPPWSAHVKLHADRGACHVGYECEVCARADVTFLAPTRFAINEHVCEKHKLFSCNAADCLIFFHDKASMLRHSHHHVDVIVIN